MVLAVALIAVLAMPGVSAAEGRYVWNHTGDANTANPFDDTTRVGFDSPLDATIRFKTDVSYSKIFFPMVWAFAHAEIKFEIFKGDTAVYTGTYTFFNESANSGDVANVELDFGKKLAPGEYTLKITAPDADNYAFFCYGEDQLSEDYIEFERGHAYFGLYTEDEGNGFVTFATEVDENAGGDDTTGGDVTPPPTADAAVIAIAAVACIALAGVVVAKKVR